MGIEPTTYALRGPQTPPTLVATCVLAVGVATPSLEARVTVVRVTTRVTNAYRGVVVRLGEAMSNHWCESWHPPGDAWPVVHSWFDSP